MKTEDLQNSNSVAVKLSGTMTQFTIMIFIFAVTIAFLFYIVNNSKSNVILYAGNSVLFLSLIAIIICSIIFFFRQKVRSTDGVAPIIEVSGPGGRKTTLINPPDSVFDLNDEKNIIMRAVMVGYDRNLCPDGEVIGPASEKNIKMYSEEEKLEFKKNHIKEITNIKRVVSNMCEKQQVEDQREEPGTLQT